MRKLLILSSILFLFCISFISSAQTVGEFAEGFELEVPQKNVFQLNQNYTTNVHVFNKTNGVQLESPAVSCRTHLYNDDGIHTLDQLMEYDLDEKEWFVNINENNFTKLGDFNIIVFCNSSTQGGYFNGNAIITSTGKSFNTGQSLSTIGILFSSLFTAFLFLYIGLRLMDNPKIAPIGFIFFVISIILIIYSLFMGWAIGSDIIEHQVFSEPAGVIFTAVLWLMVAVTLISFIFFIFSFIKALGDKKKIDRFGEGFNPITDTYDY